MRIYRLEDFTKGWFVGNFEPSLSKNSDFEVSVKKFEKGDSEPMHMQIVATEVTVVISGSIELGEKKFREGDVILIPPGEAASFKALSAVTLVCVKFPSIPNDKVIV